MNCNLSRSQKARANERQKNILSAITEDSKKLHEYGEYYMILDFINKLYDLGIEPFESIKDKQTMLFALKLGEAIRLEKKKAKQSDQQSAEHKYNTDNLYIGQVIKNYRELCKLLGVEHKSGKQKQLQLKDFLRYFDYEIMNYSQEIVILDIYDEPIKKNQQSRNSLYCNALKLIIVYNLSKAPMNDKDIYVCTTTYDQLIKQLELLSILFDKDITDYLLSKYVELTEQDFTDITNKKYVQFKRDLQIFKDRLYRRHKDSVKYALEQLNKQNIIHFESYNIIIEVMDGKKNFRQATYNEEVYILDSKREAAKELGFVNSSLASLYKKKAYYKKLSEIYNDTYGWIDVYNQIKIGANRKMLCTPINEFTNYPINYTVFELSDQENISLKSLYENNVKRSFLKSKENERQQEKDKLSNRFEDDYNMCYELGMDYEAYRQGQEQKIDNKAIMKSLFIECLVAPDETMIEDYYNYYDTDLSP